MNSSQISTAIEAEGQAIALLETQESEQGAQRTKALLAGDMKLVEKVERDLEKTRKDTALRRERVTLLTTELAIAHDADTEAHYEGLIGEVDALNAIARKIVAEYEKAAPAVARAMKQLSAISLRIGDVDRVLYRANRACASPQQFRITPAVVRHVQRVRQVGPGERDHPRRKDGSAHQGAADGRWYDSANQPLEFVTITETITETDPAIMPELLERMVALPGVRGGDRDFWSKDQRNGVDADAELAALGVKLKPLEPPARPLALQAEPADET